MSQNIENSGSTKDNEYIENDCIQVRSTDKSDIFRLYESDESDKSDKLHRRSFIITDSILSEIYIELKIFIPIAIGNCAQILPQIINNIFIGHLSNSVILLSAVNLSRTFSNVTGTSIAWGFSSALYTLIPNAIGANKHDLIRLYIQRALYIDFILFIPLTIIQCFGGEIMKFIKEPNDLINIITIYCRLLIPFIYLNTINTAIKRIAQSLNYNLELLLIQIFCGIISYPLNIFFIYYLKYGYIGTAFTLNITTFLQLLFTILLTIKIENYKYLDIFKPISLYKVLSWNGIREYLYLSIPGLAQYSLEWWIIEICIVIAGYIANPNIALGSSAIIANLTILIIMISFGNGASITYRIGKYMGASMVNHAKRSAKCGCFIGLILSIFIFLILIYFKNDIGYLWTNNKEINELISNKLIYIIIIQQFSISFYQNLGGIYRGIGYQKISAIFVILSYYVISLPLVIILLFGFNVKQNTNYSMIIIWSSLAIGNSVAAILLILHLIFYLNWNNALQRIEKRINKKNEEKQLINNNKKYGSTDDRNNPIRQ